MANGGTGATDQKIAQSRSALARPSAEEEAIGLGALTRGFNDLGYVDGKTIALHHRFPAELTERFASLSAELAAIPVDVLVAVTQPAALAAQRATTTIPIVFILVPEPVGSKLVNSFARPGSASNY